MPLNRERVPSIGRPHNMGKRMMNCSGFIPMGFIIRHRWIAAGLVLLAVRWLLLRMIPREREVRRVG